MFRLRSNAIIDSHTDSLIVWKINPFSFFRILRGCRYKELIPEVSIMALNYNQTVESIRSIVSTPSALESQSLVFAFGGPDLFFTRTSPSRGFDLLPDSFSKVLVSLVTIGLLIVLFVVKRMGSKKIVKQGWM